MPHLCELEDALGVGMLIRSPHLADHQIRHVSEDRAIHQVQSVRLAVAQDPAYAHKRFTSHLSAA